MKKRFRSRQRQVRRNTMYWILAAGFLMGVIVPNIIWRDIYAQKSLVAVYFMECLADIAGEERELLELIIRKRGGIFCLTALCGISVFGVPVAIAMILLLGFEMGSILTCSILQFGLQGGILGLGLMLPQFLFYMPGMLGICRISYERSLSIWNGKNLFDKDMYRYLGYMLLYGCVMGAGILLEGYCNPMIIKIIIKNFHFF